MSQEGKWVSQDRSMKKGMKKVVKKALRAPRLTTSLLCGVRFIKRELKQSSLRAACMIRCGVEAELHEDAIK